MADLLSNTDRALRRCRHPVARAAEVTGQPLGVVLLGEPWVLYRSGGEVRAFADRCIEIPALGAGATLPPAAHLEPAAGTAEAHGMVFVAPDEPIAPLGTIPEADDPSFMTGVLPTLRPRCPPYAVARDDWSFTMSYEHAFAHREDPGVVAGRRPLVQSRRLTYRLSAPFHLRLRIDFVDSGGSNVIGFFIQPETDETRRLFTTLWRDDLDGDDERLDRAVAFELEVLREDLRIQEAELRRVLADLVATATATGTGEEG